MINAKEHYVAWSLLVQGLDDAREHLEQLVNQMTADGSVGDEDFAIQLGHVYAHINRAWHSRNLTRESSEEEWSEFSNMPKDVYPVG